MRFVVKEYETVFVHPGTEKTAHKERRLKSQTFHDETDIHKMFHVLKIGESVNFTPDIEIQRVE